jgi:hypothetical protein
MASATPTPLKSIRPNRTGKGGHIALFLPKNRNSTRDSEAQATPGGYEAIQHENHR